MKYEWKKEEKEYYGAKATPALVQIPPFPYLTITGAGNPNDRLFPQFIEALFSVSYAIKMSPRKNADPSGYFDYAVYPLEGFWSINEQARLRYEGVLDKNDLVFKLMIKQPPFVTEDYARTLREGVEKKTGNALVRQIQFEVIGDGKCVQMLHVGSYDDEPASFGRMELFAESIGVRRMEKSHKEIYLSDFRRVSKDKLKTILRFKVE